MDHPLNVSFISPTPTVVLTDIKQLLPVNIPYLLSEIFVAILAVLGNALTLFVFVVDRKLRRLTNYYIASLALADLLVGILGVPFAILTSLGLPRSLWACLLMLSFLVVLCTISIFCLVAVSIDRYWAILYPLVYSRIMTGKMARRIILLCWCLGTIVGLLPVFGWHNEERGICLFTHIMDYDFLVFLYFFTIVGPGILMAFFYAHIYSVVLKQLRHIASQEQKTRQESESGIGTPSNSYMFNNVPRPSICSSFSVKNVRHSFKGFSFFSSKRNSEKKSDSSGMSSIGLPKSSFSISKASSSAFQISPHNSRRSSSSPLFNPQFTKASGKEIKAAKNLSIIVVFFFFCWFPLYTINCIQAFCSECPVPAELLSFTIILSHANSAINPLLYAYHMKDFRRSLEFYVLKRLGIKRFKNSNRGSPLSPHYSTVLNVNVNSSTDPTRNPSPVLSPYLETSSAIPFRLFNTNRHSTSSSVLQVSPLTAKTSEQLSQHKLYLLSLEGNRKRPANSTFSWPPTMLSRSLVSRQSLLDSNSSVDKKRRFQSLDGAEGFWSPFWDPNDNSSSDNCSAHSESRFLYEISLDKKKTDHNHLNKLHISNSAPPSPAVNILTLKSRPSSFITSPVHYQRLYSHCQRSKNKSEEKLKTDTSNLCFSVFKSKSDEQLCK